MFLNVIFYSIYLFIGVFILKKIWSIFNCKYFEWDTNNGKYWAIVTGSTDGIGFEFARQLALKGYNLMMISRNEDKLQNKRQLILNECGQGKIQIKTLAVDFKSIEIYDKIKKFLNFNEHEIFILVNNVGFGPERIDDFLDQDDQLQMDMINVNLISAMRMTKLVLPSMVEKKRGLIVNISSFASLHTFPSLAVYSSTKAFLTQFSQTMYYECLLHNILVFTLTPASVSTNMFKGPEGYMVPKARKYVESALTKINWTTPTSFGFDPHFIGHLLFCLIGLILGSKIKNNYMAFLSKKIFNENRQASLSNLFVFVRELLTDKNE